MKIKIGMMYDERVTFGRAVEEINSQWAARHGYAFTAQHALPVPALDPYWNRIPFIIQNLSDCDWFVWLDADVIIINPERSVEPELATDKHLMFSHDYNGLCCGAFAVRNCAWSEQMLQTWLFLGNVGNNAWHVFDDGFMREQTTMKALRKIFPSVNDRLGKIQEHVIQNMCSQFVPKALAYHGWAGFVGAAGIERVLARLKTVGYVPNIARE